MESEIIAAGFENMHGLWYKQVITSSVLHTIQTIVPSFHGGEVKSFIIKITHGARCTTTGVKATK